MGSVISVGVKQMCEATEDYECNELNEYPFEGKIGATDEVEEFKGDGKVGNGNEEVTHSLALQNVVDAEKPFFITIAQRIITIDGRNGGDEDGRSQQKKG